MKLFKNVSIIDLVKILKDGILPISKTGNNNWGDGRRADNSTDVVYLHRPAGHENSFTHYGFVLLEVDIDDARESALLANDDNIGRYDEFIADEVAPENITAIYIPKILKERLENLPAFVSEDLADLAGVLDRVTWCEMTAKECVGAVPAPTADNPFETKSIYEAVSDEKMKQFAKTVNLFDEELNYFRGVDANGNAMDLYDIHYEI